MLTLEQRLNGSLTLEVLLSKLVVETLREAMALAKGQPSMAKAHQTTASNLRGQILDHYNAAARGDAR